MRPNPFRVLRFFEWSLFPRVAERNLGLKLAKAFSVTLKLHQYGMNVWEWIRDHSHASAAAVPNKRLQPNWLEAEIQTIVNHS